MRVLGIDYGLKHVGFAIGDTDTRFALPLGMETYAEESEIIAHINAIISQEDVELCVVGVPMSDDHRGQAKLNTEFANRLHGATELPVVTIDETMTSREAQVRLREGGARPQSDHAVAAMLILQHYFDRMKE